ncbi:phytoene desaturase family protein [Paenibacillus sp. GYB003]|uniref:phytoene desaturase family protein n=1 Tax=Paenibacillus sp. GYB003 TaxID=2994392 RepID=UPI002F96B960
MTRFWPRNEPDKPIDIAFPLFRHLSYFFEPSVTASPPSSSCVTKTKRRRMILMNRYDAAVIGGGLSGLIAAVLLARANKSVVVLEKSERIGGRAMTIDKKGALFNLGGHALYRGGEAHSILQELGVRLKGGKPLADGFALWQNRLLPLPGDPVRLLASRLLTWSGKIELGRAMLRIGKIRTADLPDISLREWAEREIRDPMVRHLLYALCRTATYNKDIDIQPIGPVMRQIQRSLKEGVLYLNGGWQTIVDQLREMAVRAGATVMTGKSVAEIRHDGAVRGIRCADGAAIEVDGVISTLSPADTYRLVRDAERTALRRWKEAARPVKAACLDLCLRKLPVPDRHFAIGIDQPVFFTHHSRVARLSRDATLVMHLIKYNDGAESDPKADETMLESTMDLLHPGWRNEVAAKQYLPNMTVVHDVVRVGRKDAPGPAVPEIGGLYVAGDWVTRGEMLADAAAASAERAVRELLQSSPAVRTDAVRPLTKWG